MNDLREIPAFWGMCGGMLSGPGESIRAGEVQPGDMAWTRHETTGQWGAFEVYAVSRTEDKTYRAVMSDGRQPRFSIGHPLSRGGQFVALPDLNPGDLIDGVQPGYFVRLEAAGTGVVVRISVRAAQTYVIDGLLSHNKAPLD